MKFNSLEEALSAIKANHQYYYNKVRDVPYNTPYAGLLRSTLEHLRYASPKEVISGLRDTSAVIAALTIIGAVVVVPAAVYIGEKIYSGLSGMRREVPHRPDSGSTLGMQTGGGEAMEGWVGDSWYGGGTYYGQSRYNLKPFRMTQWGGQSGTGWINRIMSPIVFGASFALTGEFTRLFNSIREELKPVPQQEAEAWLRQYEGLVKSKSYMSGLSKEDRLRLWSKYNYYLGYLGMVSDPVPYPYQELDQEVPETGMETYEQYMQSGKAMQMLEEDKLKMAWDGLPQSVRLAMTERGVTRDRYLGYLRLKRGGMPEAMLMKEFPELFEIEAREPYMTYSDVMDLILDQEGGDVGQDLEWDTDPKKYWFPWKEQNVNKWRRP